MSLCRHAASTWGRDRCHRPATAPMAADYWSIWGGHRAAGGQRPGDPGKIHYSMIVDEQTPLRRDAPERAPWAT